MLPVSAIMCSTDLAVQAGSRKTGLSLAPPFFGMPPTIGSGDGPRILVVRFLATATESSGRPRAIPSQHFPSRLTFGRKVTMVGFPAKDFGIHLSRSFCVLHSSLHVAASVWRRSPSIPAITETKRVRSLSRVDHVVLSDDASRAYAVQGDINSLFKRYTDVNVAQAVGTPLAQSSAQWSHDIQQVTPAQAMPPMQQVQNPQIESLRRSP